MYIKNNDTVDITLVGQLIIVGEYYQIQDQELSTWSSDSGVLLAISNGKALMSKDGLVDIVIPSQGIDYLKGKAPINTQPLPFAQKEIDGKKLYKRVHGMLVDCVVGDNDFVFEVPYTSAKLNMLEIIGAELGDTASFYVLDTTTGAVTTIPNYVLNQFGYSIAVAKDYYLQKSEYDADVFAGLQLKCVINSVSIKKMGVNFILNELKI